MRLSYTNLYILIAIVVTFFYSVNNHAQEPVFGDDSNPFGGNESESQQQLSIYMLSPVKFGSFYPGKSGGSIFVDENGSRTATGSVVLLGGESAAAVFEIRCPSFTALHISYDSQVNITGPNGNSMIFEPDEQLINTSFVSPQNAENGFLISIGGTLFVEDVYTGVPGNYSGSFNIGVNFQ